MSELVGEVLGRLGGEGRLREYRVFDAYHRAVGPVFGARTSPESLNGTTLFVRATSGAVAHELILLRGEILQKINEQLGQTLVIELRTKVGPLRVVGDPKPPGPGRPR